MATNLKIDVPANFGRTLLKGLTVPTRIPPQWLSVIMKKDLITGVFIAAIALAAPIGLVVVEGTTRPASPRKSAAVPTKPAHRFTDANRGASLEVTPMPELPPFEEPSFASNLNAAAPSASGLVNLGLGSSASVQNQPDVVEQADPTPLPENTVEVLAVSGTQETAADAVHTEDSDPAHADQIAERPAPAAELVQYAAVGNESQFVPDVSPPEPANSTVQAAEAVAVEPPVQAAPKGANVVQVGGAKREVRDANDEKVVAELEQELAGKKPVKPVVPVAPPKKPNKEKDEIKNERCNVAVIRPLKEFVHPAEGIVGKGPIKGFPVVLVRPKEVGAEWWSQETAPRQGIYFRAIARFGNATTPEASRFKMIVAYVPREADLPEIGAQFTTLPANWIVSQEFEVVLKRN